MSILDQSGPVYRVAFNPFGPFVIMTATVIGDGETVTVEEQTDRAARKCMASNPPLRTEYERRLRHRSPRHAWRDSPPTCSPRRRI
ncbi:hypothetical protein AB5J56_43995 [Streptomyces sp. R21]|uniref:Uncharacterized protein n=1 Tax=Streptomyces sp. R21 TaxID=3238627 RepID=A0AB39PN97_9ACTN